MCCLPNLPAIPVKAPIPPIVKKENADRLPKIAVISLLYPATKAVACSIPLEAGRDHRVPLNLSLPVKRRHMIIRITQSVRDRRKTYFSPGGIHL